MAVFQDYLLRVQLLTFFMLFSQGHLDSDRWRILNDQFGAIELIAVETAFIYLVLAALVETVRRNSKDDSEEQEQEEKKSYLRALEMGLKVFGDPRANREGKAVQQGSIWLLHLLENYSRLYANTDDRLEFSFLSNLKNCAREDLMAILSSEESEKQDQLLCSCEMLTRLTPLGLFSGRMIRRSEVWDLEREISRSNCSDSCSSTGMKRLYKSVYRMNEWEFGLRIEMTEGILHWGGLRVGGPQIMPALKNCQVLSIATSNYHVVFLTEDGLYGWGENHSAQLGQQNPLKVCRQPVCIQKMDVDRLKDLFQISCGNEHTALLFNSKLMMWGL